MILAVSNDFAIGDTSRPDGLPWGKNKEDLQHFASLTKGNVVIMGGNTFRQLQDISFENGLPDRDNLVMTRDEDKVELIYDEDYYCQVEEEDYVRRFLRLHHKHDNDIFIIGGASIYQQLHPHCERVYLTCINKTFPDADVRINLDFLCNFAIISRKKLNEYSHVEVWERKK